MPRELFALYCGSLKAREASSLLQGVVVGGSAHFDQALPAVQRQFRTAALAVADIEAETVQVDDGRDDGQTQAKPAVFVIAAVKTLEHRHPFRLRYAGPGIEHFDARTAFIVHRPQDHFTAGRGEFDRVTQQIGQRLKQQRPVARQPGQGFGHIQGQGDLAFLRQGQVKVVHLLE